MSSGPSLGQQGGQQIQPWRPLRTVMLPVLGLLAAIVVIGVVAIAITAGISGLVRESVAYDIELEDNADDLRVAVLDVRHYHRDLLFNDPTPARVREWEDRYRALLGQIDELASLGVRDVAAPQPDRLREVAEEYYTSFHPAIALFATDATAFELSSLEGLERLDELDGAAAVLDGMGEDLAAQALLAIENAAGNSVLALVVVLAGLVAIGALLALALLRLARESQRVVARERAAALALAQVSQAKTDFIADVSHELRTPLTVLRGNAEVGLAMQADCDHGDILREIVDESARMGRMVDDLLFLARSDATAPPLEVTETDGDALMADIAARGIGLARERGAQLVTQIDQVGSIQVDPARFAQAVLILVDNAAKYAPGEPARLSAAVANGTLTVAVTDRGPGIAPDEVQQVFDRFFRSRGKRRESGAGLGLSIARTIVDGHGGRIAASSPSGGGATMTISLPVDARERALTASVQPEP